MKQRPTRTEDDLRAAFHLAAQDAPAPADVLAAIERPAPSARRRRWGTWAPLAAVAVVIIAIVVPVVAIAHNSSGQKSAASSAAGKAVFGAAASAPRDAASSAAGPGPDAPVPSAGGGMVTPGPDVSQPGAGQPADICRPSDVTASLHWTSESGGLAGVLTLTNHTSTTCEVLGKPSIRPLDASGKPLDVQTMVSAEGRIGQTHLVAGASASATISWPSWCGKPAGKTVEVDWGAGADPLTATGPTTPSSCNTNSANGGNNISSEWFNPLS